MAIRATAYQKRLEDGGFAPQQAYALAAAQEDMVLSELVTRNHFDSAIQRLDGKINGLDAKLEGKIAGLEGKIVGLDGRIAALDAKIDTRTAELRGEIAALRAEMKGDFASLQVTLIRWMVGTVGGSTLAVMLALPRFAR